jgi:hypothetical protein
LSFFIFPARPMMEPADTVWPWSKMKLIFKGIDKEPRWSNGYRIRLIRGRSRIQSRATSD